MNHFRRILEGKTEHSGAKKGKGAFWGPKKDAKKTSNKQRRSDGKKASMDEGKIVKNKPPIYGKLAKDIMAVTKTLAAIRKEIKSAKKTVKGTTLNNAEWHVDDAFNDLKQLAASFKEGDISVE